MVTALVSHLVRQGTYQANDIAVLTPYLGQLQKIRKVLQASFEISLSEGDTLELEKQAIGNEEETPKGSAPVLQKTSLLKALKVSTIDNFQGEEAKVVVISLVRSNDQNKCGFLRTFNRINVLLSRAKHGMYIFANSRTSCHVQMWSSVIQTLRSGGNFGPSLELQCARHPENVFQVSKPDDFHIFSPEGPKEMAMWFGKSTASAHRSVAGTILPADTNARLLVMEATIVNPVENRAKSHVATRGAVGNVATLAHPVLSISVLLAARMAVAHSLVPRLCPTDVKDMVVDFLEMAEFAEVDLDEDPCLIPSCGHITTTSSMDGYMAMSKHYTIGPGGKIVDILEHNEPFSVDELKVCSTCRGSLRRLSRYGRIVRRAAIDEATKKFIVSANRVFMRLFESFHRQNGDLMNTRQAFGREMRTTEAGKLALTDGRDQQLAVISKAPINGRYSQALRIRHNIRRYLRSVDIQEQPFKRGWDMVQHARKRQKTDGDMQYQPTVLQTSQTLQATALLLRCDLAILSDFLELMGPNQG
ncbi:hypothetical protein H2202_009755 [Exophiala xenobiotica]|nr:hypothetical protein H2202_009755 [Exophiala xenobiotica]